MIHVPEGTFVHSYMKMMAEQETPAIYDMMCAFWCLSNALGRDVIVDRPRAPVHLNMYCILVSESGIMRKSTSVRAATVLTRDFFNRIESKTLMIESKATMGEIAYELNKSTREQGQAHLVFVASELAASFGRTGGVSNTVAMLTDLYDCPDVKTGAANRLSKISYNLKDVYISFLGGSTPVWLSSAVTPSVIEGGFTSRCYFVVGKRRKKVIAWPIAVDETQLRAQLLTQLEDIHGDSKTYSRIGITSGAKSTFERWYEGRIIHNDIYRESFESREDAHVLRFAGLFAANERVWLINDDHIRRGIDFVGELKDAGAGLFTGTTATSNSIRWLERVRTTLLKAGEAGISKTDLTRVLNAKYDRTAQLRATLHTMHELDLIKIIEITFEGMRGRPRTMYYATPYLSNEAFLEDVVRKLGLER